MIAYKCSFFTSIMHFRNHSPQRLRDALIIDMKFNRPTQIQRHSLPIILNGDNLIAQAQTSGSD